MDNNNNKVSTLDDIYGTIVFLTYVKEQEWFQKTLFSPYAFFLNVEGKLVGLKKLSEYHSTHYFPIKSRLTLTCQWICAPIHKMSYVCESVEWAVKDITESRFVIVNDH